MSGIKNIVRPIRDLVYALSGFFYDFSRFAKYSGYKNDGLGIVSRYRLIKVYHAIEKSLSFRERKAASGWSVAHELKQRLDAHSNKYREDDFHSRVGMKVLAEFIEGSNYDCAQKDDISKFLLGKKINNSIPGGAKVLYRKDLESGILESPETFFLSRYTIRDYSDQSVDFNDVRRAIGLAMKSPSACSRQAWHVYYADSRNEIDKILNFQSGNKGFGHEVPFLLLITADLRAFDNASERYQHWIDGGMFSMSVIYALHSIGMGSCCLNWSKGPLDDMAMRKVVGIKDEESLVMMLAVGYPNEMIKVCQSPRDDVNSIFSKISTKDH